MIRCGTCAWADHQHFYPKSVKPIERLRFYARYFSVVEVDSTYYALPKPAASARWTEQTPAAFRFDVKAHHTMTLHDRSAPELADKLTVFRAFDAVLQPLRAAGRLSAILFQFPPWFTLSSVHKRYVEGCRFAFAQDMVAVEFRHQTWFAGAQRDQTLVWLQSIGAIHVICDEPQVGTGSVPLVPDVTDARLALLRLHGKNTETWSQAGLATSAERFRYLYAREELEPLARIAQNLQRQTGEVHVLMNNNYDNFAIRGALLMQQVLGQAGSDLLLDELSSRQLGWFGDDGSS